MAPQILPANDSSKEPIKRFLKISPPTEFYHFPHFFDIEEKQACVLSLYDLMTVDEESLQQYAQHQVAKDGSIHVNIPDAAGFIKSLLALRFNQPIKIDTIALTPGGSTWMLK